MVPLVPKLAVTTPARVLPVPIAPIILSPPPALTIIPGFRSSALAVELFHDFLPFNRGGGIAPQFGRADNFSRLIKRHKAVLLAADADGFHIGGDGFGLAQSSTNAAGGRLAPGVRMLLLRAGGKIA